VCGVAEPVYYISCRSGNGLISRWLYWGGDLMLWHAFIICPCFIAFFFCYLISYLAFLLWGYVLVIFNPVVTTRGSGGRVTRKWFPCSVSLYISEYLPCVSWCLRFWMSLRTSAKQAFFSFQFSTKKSLCKHLMVWLVSYGFDFSILLSFSFSLSFKPPFHFWDDIYEFHCSSLCIRRVLDLVWSFFGCAYCSKGCSLGFIRFSILPFGFFSLSSRDGLLFMHGNLFFSTFSYVVFSWAYYV